MLIYNKKKKNLFDNAKLKIIKGTVSIVSNNLLNN